jgi:ketosteroid isomerase-like protein
MYIRCLQARATTDDEGHYFTDAMRGIYAAALAAQKVRGKRVHDVRAAELLRGVTAQDGPYKHISNSVRRDYDAMFKTTTDKLWTDLNAVFEHIRHDVNQVCSTKEDDSPEAKKMREELLAMLPEARDRLEKEILRELSKCKENRGKTKMEE